MVLSSQIYYQDFFVGLWKRFPAVIRPCIQKIDVPLKSSSFHKELDGRKIFKFTSPFVFDFSKVSSVSLFSFHPL